MEGALREHVRPAVVTVVLQLVAVVLCVVVVLDVRMFGPYLPALLWAVLLSLPLRRAKTACLEFAFGGAAFRRRALSGVLSAALGPLWSRFFGRAAKPQLQQSVQQSPPASPSRGKGGLQQQNLVASAPYFRLLWRAVLLYGAAHLAKWIGWSAALCAFGTAAALAAGAFVLRRLLLSRAPKAPFSPTQQQKRRSEHQQKQQATTAAPTKPKWPAFMDTFAAVFLIVVFLVAAVAGTALLAVRIGQESAGLYEDTRSFVGASLPQGLSGDIRATVVQNEGMLVDAIEKGRLWAVDWLQQRHPEVNITELWSSGVYLYAQLFGGNTSSAAASHSATAEPVKEESEHAADDGSQLSAARLVLGNLSQGSLWSALKQLPDAISEVRAAMSAQKGAEGFLGGILGGVGHIFVGSASVLGHATLAVLGVLGWLFVRGFSFLMQFFIFCSALFYLLVAKKGAVESFGRTLSGIFGSDELVVSIESSVTAVFASTAKLFVFHTVFTALVFSVFNINLVALSAIFSGFAAAFPFVSPLLVCVIAVPQLLVQGRLITLLVVFGLHFFVWWSVDTAIYGEIPDSHTMTAGLGVVLGISAFGIHGVLFGPLLVCLPVIVYRWFSRTAEK